MALPYPAPQFPWGYELQQTGQVKSSTYPDKKSDAIAATSDSITLQEYVHYNDYYYTAESQKVLITCYPKGVNVEAMLTEPIKISGSATWNSFIDTTIGQLGASNIINVADFIGRTQGAGTLREPWLSRKLWNGSDA